MQVVIYLRPTESEFVRQTRFVANNLQHDFQVIRLWEESTEVFLQRPGLLPYAVLSQTSNRSSVLREVAQAIDLLPEQGQRANVAAATGILAGLVLDEQVIRQVLRREPMKESVIYQVWCQFLFPLSGSFILPPKRLVSLQLLEPKIQSASQPVQMRLPVASCRLRQTERKPHCLT